jgi:hypothetical protein
VQDRLREATNLAVLDDHSKHEVPGEAVTRVPRSLSNGGATARH